MKKKNYKGRCTKRSSPKSKEICKTYNFIADKYLVELEENENIKEIRLNVPLLSSEGSDYTTDFLCVKQNGDLMVRETVFKNLISKPMTVKMLDISRNYWLNHGVLDWGIVTNED